MHVSILSSNMVDRTKSSIAVYCRTDAGLNSLRVEVTDTLNVATTIAGCDDVTGDALRTTIEALNKVGCAIMTSRGVFIEVDVHGRDPGFAEVLAVIENSESALEHLVVPASTASEISALIEAAVAHDVHVCVVPGPWFDGDGGGSMGEVLQRRAGVGEEWSGRPPLGFEVKDGHLVESEDYGDVCGTLRLVQTGKLSKRAAADELDTSRRTINRCLDNPSRYGLAD